MAKILLIDRNIAQGARLAEAIKGTAREIDVVHSTTEAAAIVKREPFDMVILDVSAEADPGQAVKLVRDSIDAASAKRLGLVAITASFSESSFLMDSGAVDMLLEFPAHLEQLTQVVEQLTGC